MAPVAVWLPILTRNWPVKRFFSTLAGPVTNAVRKRVETGKIRRDDEQLVLASRLDRLYQELKSTDAKVTPSHQLSILHSNTNNVLRRALHHFYQIFQPRPPRGLYIFGSVGVGKSMLMDTFYRESWNATHQRKHKRIHFHEFMLSVHERIHEFKKQHPRGDALPAVAWQLATECRLLCFDEFQVTDIADAMILKRLFDMLLDFGVVVVATSNRAPSELYKGGINRSRFLPFIDTLHAHLDVVEMKGTHDYRRDGANAIADLASTCFFWPCTDSRVRQRIKQCFGTGVGTVRTRVISVRMGRTIEVARATDSMAWFDFNNLCEKPLGPADYLALCESFQTIIVDHVPQLNSQKFNAARRFVALIDALYETKTKLNMASHVPLQDLFVDFDVVAQTKDGDEEIIPEHDREMFVKGEGGSSSSAATTMIRTKSGEEVEWSATGRIGVSLAELSSVQDVSFAFRRAESRLVEMNRPSWGTWGE